MENNHISLVERVFIISKAYESISKQFIHWEDAFITIEDFDEYYKVFLQRAIHTDNKFDFGRLMLEFLAPLNNRHTIYWDESLLPYMDWDHMENMIPMGFYIENMNDSWIVTESMLKELQPGDCLESINDQPMNELISKLSKYLHELNDTYKTSRLNLLFPLLYQEESYKITYRNQLNQQMEVVTHPHKINHRQLETKGFWITKEKIAYIKIPSFSQSKYLDKALELVDKFFLSESIIIDLRGNTGGSTPTKLIKKLMNKPWRSWRWWSFDTKKDVENTRIQYIEPLENTYQGNLIFLVDRNTGSAAEDLIVPFKDNGVATIIGERTWGSTGQPYIYETNNKILLIGARRVSMPNGQNFEGIGIQPDICVNKLRKHIYENHDAALEKALAFIRLEK